MKRKDLKAGVAYATFKKEHHRYNGPFEKFYIEGDPNLAWEWGEDLKFRRVDRGPGVLVRFDGDLGIAKVKKIVGTFEETIEGMQERNRKFLDSLGCSPEEFIKNVFGKG